MSLTTKQAEKVCEKLGEDLVSFSFLAKGNHNDNYLLETEERKYVLRIENKPQFTNLKGEYKTLKSLKAGLGPQVFLFDNSHEIISNDYLVEEYISGEHPDRKPSDEFVRAMAEWLKELHSIKTSSLEKCTEEGYYSLQCAIEPYYENFKNHKNSLSNELRQKLESLFQRALKLCEENDKIFEGRGKFSLLHRDLSKDNIFVKEQSIKLVDWEFAGYGVREWDLVYFFQSFDLNDKQEKLFLEKYGYPKNSNKKLDMISLLNVAGGVGYSVWRLGLIKEGELSKDKKNQVLERLKQDTELFEKIIEGLEK